MAAVNYPGAVRIREIDTDHPEWDELRALDTRLLPEAPPSPDTLWWAAFNGGDVVAYAGGRVLVDGSFFLSRAGVIDHWRGHGLQKRLIRVRVAKARKMGCHRAVTYTMPHNAPSINSLIRCGFRCYAPEPEWAGPGAVFWQVRLS